VPLDRVVKGRVPGVELEARLAPEAFAGGLQLGTGEGGDGFAGDGAGQGVSEMALAAALAVAEAAVQQPGGVDQEGLRKALVVDVPGGKENW
jgi:hypothetical protein